MPRPPFHFTLDPVLALRERAVEAARATLVRTVGASALAEAAVARAEAALTAHLAAPGGAAQTAGRLGGSAAHRAGLAQAVEAARWAVARAATDERRARQALAAALRQHEALDRLRADAADAHRADALRAETATLDELASGARRPPVPS